MYGNDITNDDFAIIFLVVMEILAEELGVLALLTVIALGFQYKQKVALF